MPLKVSNVTHQRARERHSKSCAGEYAGLEEMDNGIWNAYFGAVKLGCLIEEQMRIEDGSGQLWRHGQKA